MQSQLHRPWDTEREGFDVESGQDRAIFEERDINFIQIVEHSVFHDGKPIPWEKVMDIRES